MSFHMEGDGHQANGQELELFPRRLERKSKYKLLHWLLGNLTTPKIALACSHGLSS